MGSEMCIRDSYEWAGCASARYSIHGENLFVSAERSPGFALRRQLKLLRLVEWAGRQSGAMADLRRYAVLEFITIAAPTAREALLYIALQLSADEPLTVRLRHCTRIFIRFLKSRVFSRRSA